MKNASPSIIDDFLVIVLGNANNRDQVMPGYRKVRNPGDGRVPI